MDNFFNGVDARKEIENIIKHNGLKILYVRNNSNSRCKCYNPLHKDGNSKCVICGGSGILSSIEGMDVFCNPMSMDDSLKIFGEKKAELGNSNVMSQTFYLKHNEKPKTGDKIIIVGYDKCGLPTEVKKSYTIAICSEVRGFDGRIEAYKVMCRTSPQLIKLDQIRLNSIPNQHKIKLMKGVRYQWGR